MCEGKDALLSKIKELEHANEVARLAIVGLEAQLSRYADLVKAAREVAAYNSNARPGMTLLNDALAALDKKGE